LWQKNASYRGLLLFYISGCWWKGVSSTKTEQRTAATTIVVKELLHNQILIDRHDLSVLDYPTATQQQPQQAIAMPIKS
jgi:hypothetical protein